MKRELTHDEAFLVLDAVALDALEGAERDAVLAHADNCEICRVELSQLRETAAFLAFSSPLGSDTATRSRSRIHSRLMARASTDAPPIPTTGIHRTQPTTSGIISMLAWRRAEWMAIAASVLLVVSVALLASLVRDRENLRASLKEQTALNQHALTASDSLRVAVMHRDSVIAELTGKDVAMMTLTSTGAKAPFGHMFWDRTKNTWTLVTHNLPDLKPGRTYQLWLVTPTAKISAGTFQTQGGEAMVRATYPLSPSQLMALAVTEEPMGGMPQPTGAPVMSVAAH